MQKDYSIGLDIGTSSVGWAVVNSDTYEIIKKKTIQNNFNLNTGEETKKFSRKALWGVRLFEEAKTATDRRMARSTRRRYDRRRKRIKLLQDGLMKAVQGITTLEEILKLVELDDSESEKDFIDEETIEIDDSIETMTI